MSTIVRARRPRLIHLTTVDLSLRVLLAHQLVRFREAGFEVAGASAPGPYVAGIEALGIEHLPVPSLGRSWTPGQDAVALRDLVRLFRSERPDIVHTHNPKSGVLGRVAARLARVPVVVNTVHGLYANPALPPVRRGLISAAERVASRFSDHELFQSREDYDWAIRNRVVPAKRASWLGNGVDLTRFDPLAVDPAAVAAVRTGWGAEGGSIVVGTVGRLVTEKGYPELFEAARTLRGRASFVVVGPEEPTKSDRLDDGLVRRARDEGVVFHGEGTDMPVILAALDVFVLASHREGVPRSAIEAQAMERAAVVTDIRGCREVVDPGETGLLVPARDPAALAAAVERLLGDPRERERMGRAGRARMLAGFDEEAVVERTLEVYGRLMARGRR
ncbi:MAG TPA: glycosyltransferase family 4 protein [Actinomycetota bacterium]|jgi:glycosyltransferase involved in cell wall biosynthesis